MKKFSNTQKNWNENAHKAGVIAKPAAVLLTAILSIMLIFVSCNGNSDTQYSLSTALSPPPAESSPAAETTQRRIVSGDSDEEIMPQEVPPIGEYVLSGWVTKVIRDSENEGTLFYVALYIANIDESEDLERNGFIYEGKTIKEWSEILNHEKYLEGFQNYYSEKYVNNDAGTEENFENAEREWDKLWYETHGFDFQQKQIEINQAYESARAALWKSIRQEEIIRLQSLGLMLVKDENGNPTMRALLTKEQILNFPCGKYGYIITKAEGDDIVNQ